MNIDHGLARPFLFLTDDELVSRLETDVLANLVDNQNREYRQLALEASIRYIAKHRWIKEKLRL